MLRTLGVKADVDAGLVTALRGGDPDAAVQLVERYGEHAYRLAARVTGAPADAEEAAQTALLTAARTIDAFTGDTNFGAWIDRLAAREAYRKLLAHPAAAGREAAEAAALDEVLPPLDGRGLHFEPMRDWSDRIEAAELQCELRHALNDALEALPADYRAALVLHDVEGMQDAEIAEALGITPAGVRARVHRARLFARKPSGGRVELLLVEDLGDPVWRCLVRGRKSLANGVVLELLPRRGASPRGAAPKATYLGDGKVRFDAPIFPVLDDWGELPLPPYIDRAAGPTENDRERYQTVFARAPGAVAAPTAGLHFTDEMLAGLDHVSVTLHVGPGTFAPVRVDDVTEHVMHVERYEVPAATAAAIDAARSAGRPIVAVGTTVVRTLESALGADGRLAAGPGSTQLFLYPGRPIRAVDLLVTNFHMPRSTLLMLVCAFASTERVLAAYREAVAARYRFFSYGDAMLLRRARP